MYTCSRHGDSSFPSLWHCRIGPFVGTVSRCANVLGKAPEIENRPGPAWPIAWRSGSGTSVTFLEHHHIWRLSRPPIARASEQGLHIRCVIAPERSLLNLTQTEEIERIELRLESIFSKERRSSDVTADNSDRLCQRCIGVTFHPSLITTHKTNNHGFLAIGNLSNASTIFLSAGRK